MNEYERKFDAAMAEMAATNMWRSNYAPPLMSLQRRMGWLVRPPLYASFWRVVLGYALWFGPIWGVLMWFTSWRGQGFSVMVAVGASAFAGLLFGLLLALFYAKARRKHRLSRWEDL